MAGEYQARINRVVDYIENHLEDELSLEELSRVAAFSKYHFHRIFCGFTGETLFRFIQRLRLEKAATLLIADPERSITEIALSCGFSGSAPFARAFKEYFSCSASQWRREKSNISKEEGNPGKAEGAGIGYIQFQGRTLTWRMQVEKETRTVTVKELPEMTVAYIRYVGPYKGDGGLFTRLWTKLMTWAGPRNLVDPGKTQFLAIYHDNPDLTEDSKLRTSVCLSVPPDTEISGEVGKMTVPGGTYAMARFELGEKDYQQAWNWVYCDWLPQSGYLPDDRPAFEMFPQEGKASALDDDPDAASDCKKKTHTVDICIPVKPM